MISVAALAMIFLGVYRPDGMLNALLKAIGLSASPGCGWPTNRPRWAR